MNKQLSQLAPGTRYVLADGSGPYVAGESMPPGVTLESEVFIKVGGLYIKGKRWKPARMPKLPARRVERDMSVAEIFGPEGMQIVVDLLIKQEKAEQRYARSAAELERVIALRPAAKPKAALPTKKKRQSRGFLKIFGL